MKIIITYLIILLFLSILIFEFMISYDNLFKEEVKENMTKIGLNPIIINLFFDDNYIYSNSELLNKTRSINQQ